MKHSPMTQVAAEDRAIKNAKAENQQAMSKILTLGLQLSEVREPLSLVKGNENTHEIIVLEKDFLWGMSFRSRFSHFMAAVPTPYHFVQNILYYPVMLSHFSPAPVKTGRAVRIQ